MNQIFLSKKELDKVMKKRLIGEGTEGKVFHIKGNILYKIYHGFGDYLNILPTPIYDEEGVNIASVKNGQKDIKRNRLLYYDEEGVILSKGEALIKAIEKQKDVKYSKLPICPIYSKETKRIIGTELYYHKHAGKIYNVSILPQKLRLLVMRELLMKVRELVQNNIYHIDLYQKPNGVYNNTNVLLNYKLEPIIVDLDGISTIYTATYKESLYKRSEMSLAYLMMEIISNCEIDENMESIDAPYLIEELLRSGLPDEMVEDFFKNNLSLDKMDNYITRMLKKQKD